ncbi:MAG TPA: M48 family metalloprotease [Dehalococcoidia bacterium]|nr:M48 family metalloprotease [Dehalococcoidia bacterium]
MAAPFEPDRRGGIEYTPGAGVQARDSALSPAVDATAVPAVAAEASLPPDPLGEPAAAPHEPASGASGDAGQPERRFPGIDARSFRDRRDAERMARVRLLKGLDFIYSRFLNLGVEGAMAHETAAQAVQLHQGQAEALWALLDRAAQVLDVRVPDLYLGRYENGMQTIGHERPFIVASADYVDLLDDDELVFAFGRELGHILLGHVTYKMLARSIGAIGDTVGTFTLNVGSMVTTGLEAPLRDWDQFSEFSADRAGLLAVGRLDVALSALLKQAAGGQRFFDRMSVPAFVEQGRRALYGERPAGTRLSAIARSLQAGAPLLAARAAALSEWYGGGEFAAIVHGQYVRRGG